MFKPKNPKPDPWKTQVDAARIEWDQLTENEIRESAGRIQKLAGLVQERYAIPLVEAENQVMRFLDKQAGPQPAASSRATA